VGEENHYNQILWEITSVGNAGRRQEAGHRQHRAEDFGVPGGNRRGGEGKG